MFVRIPNGKGTGTLLLNLDKVKVIHDLNSFGLVQIDFFEGDPIYSMLNLDQIHEVINQAYKQFDVK